MKFIRENSVEEVYQCERCKDYRTVPRGCDKPLCYNGCACNTCDGTTNVIDSDNKAMDCPKCNGSGCE